MDKFLDYTILSQSAHETRSFVYVKSIRIIAYIENSTNNAASKFLKWREILPRGMCAIIDKLLPHEQEVLSNTYSIFFRSLRTIKFNVSKKCNYKLQNVKLFYHKKTSAQINTHERAIFLPIKVHQRQHNHNGLNIKIKHSIPLNVYSKFSHILEIKPFTYIVTDLFIR